MRKGVRDREEGGEGKEREEKETEEEEKGRRERKKLSHSTSYKSLTQLCLVYNMNMFSL